MFHILKSSRYIKKPFPERAAFFFYGKKAEKFQNRHKKSSYEKSFFLTLT